jgi:hypothetical protein
VCGAPSVEHELGLSHRGYLLCAFAFPLMLAAALEAGVALAFDVFCPARLVLFGQAALAAALAFAAWTPRAWGLTLALAVAGASSGVACSASQALLVLGDRGGAERALVRWSLFAASGDVLAPLVTAAAIALGLSYRGAMAAIALAVAAQCCAAAWQRVAARAAPTGSGEPDPPAETLRGALARAIRLPRLWAWLLAAASCTLLDETVVALAALRMQHDGRASSALATAAAVAFSAGSVAGAWLTDGAVARWGGRRVLVTSAILCGVSLVTLIEASGVLASSAALLVVGVTCAPHHALAMARAHGELEGRPGVVQAVAQTSVVVDVGAAIAIGAVADRFGLGAAVACLIIQPAVILACALAIRSRVDDRAPAP